MLLCLVWISEQTAIFSLYSIKLLVFTTQTECVYWAVRTESLTIILVIFRLSVKISPSVILRFCQPHESFRLL
jgi:hypothetical protein